MKKTKEYYICDRCKKTIEDYSKKENYVTDVYNGYFYDLCKECMADFNEYKIKLSGLDKTYKTLSEKYKFGRYLPREELKDSDDNE